MENLDLVDTPDSNTYSMCSDCGRKIDTQDILDSGTTQSCFYCNRKQVQRF